MILRSFQVTLGAVHGCSYIMFTIFSHAVFHMNWVSIFCRFTEYVEWFSYLCLGCDNLAKIKPLSDGVVFFIC